MRYVLQLTCLLHFIADADVCMLEFDPDLRCTAST